MSGGEPLPNSITVNVNGKERRITLGTNVFCPKTLRELLVLQRAKVKADLDELKELQAFLPPETYKEQAEEVMALWNEVKEGNPTAATRCIQTLEGLQVVLLNSSPEIVSADDAKAVLDSMESYMELVDLIGEIQKDVEEKSGNSLPPEGEDEEKTE